VRSRRCAELRTIAVSRAPEIGARCGRKIRIRASRRLPRRCAGIPDVLGCCGKTPISGGLSRIFDIRRGALRARFVPARAAKTKAWRGVAAKRA
jgi:hypothetical protein